MDLTRDSTRTLNKLNGWQRLWVFFSLLYLGTMAIFAFLTMPGEYSVPHSTELYEQMSQASVERLLRASEAKTISRVEMPNGHSIPFPSDMPEPEMTAVAKEYSDLLAREGRKKRLRLQAHWPGGGFPAFCCTSLATVWHGFGDGFQLIVKYLMTDCHPPERVGKT